MATNHRERSRFAKPAFIGMAGLVAGTGLLVLAAWRSGRSLRGELVATGVLPIRSRARASSSPHGYARMIAANRKAGPAQPSSAIRHRYEIGEKAVAGGLVLTITRRDVSTERRVLYLHGGAFVLDLLPEHWPILTALAEQTEATIVVPLYPLAPENDWQPAYAMIDALYDATVADVGADNIVMAGDSAGGGLVLSLCQRFRDQGRSLPLGLVLLSPWADLTVSDPAQTELARRDRILSIDRLRDAGFDWAGKHRPNDPIVNPLFGSLDDLPPMLVLTGTDDILNSDAHRLATSARASGSRLDLREYRGMFHLWVAAPIPEAKAGMKEVADFIGECFVAGYRPQRRLSQN